MEQKTITRGRPLSTSWSQRLGFSIDTTLVTNLLPWRNAVLTNDMDFACVVDGKEGSGKSTLVQQAAIFMDVDHELDIETQIHFDVLEMKRAIRTLKKGKAVIFDESRRGLNRRRSHDEVVLDFLDLLAECRQHNLFLFFVIPSFYDMDMNAAVWRTRMLIHTYWVPDVEHQTFQKGYFFCYGEEAKKQLYCDQNNRRFYRYPKMARGFFMGRFSKHMVVDPAAYKKKKHDAEAIYEQRRQEARDRRQGPDLETLQKVRQQSQTAVIEFLRRNQFLKRGAMPALANLLKISDRTLYDRCIAMRSNLDEEFEAIGAPRAYKRGKEGLEEGEAE